MYKKFLFYVKSKMIVYSNIYEMPTKEGILTYICDAFTFNSQIILLENVVECELIIYKNGSICL